MKKTPRYGRKKTRKKPSKSAILHRAEKAAASLLDPAVKQAKRGEPRLIAEIFRFLRPNKPIVLQVKPPRCSRPSRSAPTAASASTAGRSPKST
jgi:hypothetical protein